MAHQGCVENSLPGFKLPQVEWQTSRAANYVVYPTPKENNLKYRVPWDLNYGRSDWLLRGFPTNKDWDLMQDSELPAPAPFAIQQQISTYQFVPYEDEVILDARPTVLRTPIGRHRNTL